MVTVPTFWLCGSIVFGSPLADQRTVWACAADTINTAAKAANHHFRFMSVSCVA